MRVKTFYIWPFLGVTNFISSYICVWKLFIFDPFWCDKSYIFVYMRVKTFYIWPFLMWQILYLRIYACENFLYLTLFDVTNLISSYICVWKLFIFGPFWCDKFYIFVYMRVKTFYIWPFLMWQILYLRIYACENFLYLTLFDVTNLISSYICVWKLFIFDPFWCDKSYIFVYMRVKTFYIWPFLVWQILYIRIYACENFLYLALFGVTNFISSYICVWKLFIFDPFWCDKFYVFVYMPKCKCMWQLLYERCLWHWIICKGLYALKQRNQSFHASKCIYAYDNFYACYILFMCNL